MTAHSPSALSDADYAQIQRALNEALPNGPVAHVERISHLFGKGGVYVDVVPDSYPENHWAFIEAVAGAEIGLRDAGLKVHLIPTVDQRILLVAHVGERGIAILTTEDRKWKDLQIATGLKTKELDALDVSAVSVYGYDTEEEKAEVLAEARAEHPGADFGLIPH